MGKSPYFHEEKVCPIRKAKGEKSRRKRGQQRLRCLDGITDSMDMSLSKLLERVGQGSLHARVHGVAKSWTRLSD